MLRSRTPRSSRATSSPARSSRTLLAQSVVRTADPIKRGLKESDFPRTVKVTDNVYTYEDFHAGDEKFTTTNMFVVTRDGVLIADGQGSPAETKGLVDAIAQVTDQADQIRRHLLRPRRPHGRQRLVSAGVNYLIHPTSKAILDRRPPRQTRARRVEAPGRRGARRRTRKRSRWAAKSFRSSFSAARTPAAI